MVNFEVWDKTIGKSVLVDSTGLHTSDRAITVYVGDSVLIKGTANPSQQVDLYFGEYGEAGNYVDTRTSDSSGYFQFEKFLRGVSIWYNNTKFRYFVYTAGTYSDGIRINVLYPDRKPVISATPTTVAQFGAINIHGSGWAVGWDPASSVVYNVKLSVWPKGDPYSVTVYTAPLSTDGTFDYQIVPEDIGTYNIQGIAVLIDVPLPSNIITVSVVTFVCNEGDIENTTFCDPPFAETWKSRKICQNNTWVTQTQQCPLVEEVINIQVLGSGTTDPAVGNHSVIKGSYVTLTAFPSNGWIFSHWESLNGGTSSLNPMRIGPVDTGDTITAVFIDASTPCTEGDVSVQEYCSDNVTPKREMICQNGTWVSQTNVCPTGIADDTMLKLTAIGIAVVGLGGYLMMRGRGKGGKV